MIYFRWCTRQEVDDSFCKILQKTTQYPKKQSSLLNKIDKNFKNSQEVRQIHGKTCGPVHCGVRNITLVNMQVFYRRKTQCGLKSVTNHAINLKIQFIAFVLSPFPEHKRTFWPAAIKVDSWTLWSLTKTASSQVRHILCVANLSKLQVRLRSRRIWGFDSGLTKKS